MATTNTECIREEMSQIVTFTQSAFNPSKKILIRRWEVTDPIEASTAAEDLRLRTSVRNTADVECHYIDNPMTRDGGTYNGRYRCVSVKEWQQGDSWYIDQTLSCGYVDAFNASLFGVLKGTTTGYSSSGDVTTRTDAPEKTWWLYIDGIIPSKTEDIVASIRAYNWQASDQTMTTLDSVVVAGSYNLITVERKRNDDDTDTVTVIVSYDIVNKAQESVVFDPFTKTETISNKNSATKPTLPTSQTTGEYEIVRRAYNELKLWDEERQKETAVFKYWGGDPSVTNANKFSTTGGSYVTRWGTVYWWIVHNATDAQWAGVLTEANLTCWTDNSVRFEINKYGRIDGSITKTPYEGATNSTDSWVLGVIGAYQYDGPRVYKQAEDKTWKYKIVTYREIVEQHGGYAAAINAANGTMCIKGGPGGSSRVEALKNGQYVSYFITSNEEEMLLSSNEQVGDTTVSLPEKAKATWVPDVDL